MFFAPLRRFSLLLLSLCAFFLAACEPVPPGAVNILALGPAKTNEDAFGPSATAEEITTHFSGTSFTYHSPQTALYFGSDGQFSEFSSDQKNRYFSVGKWGVDGSSGTDLLQIEQTVYRVTEGNVTSEEVKSSYRVYIRGDLLNKNSVSLDVIEDGRFEGATGFLKYAGKGFLREYVFNATRRNVLEGVPAEGPSAGALVGEGPSAGALVAEGVVLLLLCVVSALILC